MYSALGSQLRSCRRKQRLTEPRGPTVLEVCVDRPAESPEKALAGRPLLEVRP